MEAEKRWAIENDDTPWASRLCLHPPALYQREHILEDVFVDAWGCVGRHCVAVIRDGQLLLSRPTTGLQSLVVD